jgi:hypothetical protein
MYSPARYVCRGSLRKKVRINPIVERTVVQPKRYARREYEPFGNEIYYRDGHRYSSRNRHYRGENSFDSFSDVEARRDPYRYKPRCRTRTRTRTRTRSPIPNFAKTPKRENPYFRPPSERAQYQCPRSPMFQNRNAVLNKKSHYFARGDALTHKNLTRTYVFHR